MFPSTATLLTTLATVEHRRFAAGSTMPRGYYTRALVITVLALEVFLFPDHAPLPRLVFFVGQKGHNYVRAYQLPVRLLQTGNHHGNNAYFEQRLF